MVFAFLMQPQQVDAQTVSYDAYGNPIYNYNYNPYTYATAGTVLGYSTANQATINSLQQQLQVLLSQVRALQGSTPNTFALTSTPSVLGVSTSSNSPSCSFNRDLYQGYTGTDVRELQRMLGISQTGIYDSATRTAVENFQSLHATEILYPAGFNRPTGIVGPMTRSVLNEMCNGVATVGSVLGASTIATPVIAPITPVITPVISDPYPPTPPVTGNNIGTLNFYAEPNPISNSDDTTLIWQTTGATQCIASGAWSGILPPNGARVLENIRHNSTYTIRCTGPSVNLYRNVTVQVGGIGTGLTPVITMNANPSSVNFGERTQITWNATNATSCQGLGGTSNWNGFKSRSGSFQTGPIVAPTTFTLQCRSSQYNSSNVNVATESVTVSVGGNSTGSPIITFSANPANINSGESTILNWSTTNAASCTASGDWSGEKATSGTFAISSITSDRTYTLTCRNVNGNAATHSVAVNVN